LSNMAAKNKEIGGPNGFEGLLKYYVKLTRTRLQSNGSLLSFIMSFYWRYFHHG
jgi:hypothetical protein